MSSCYRLVPPACRMSLSTVELVQIENLLTRIGTNLLILTIYLSVVLCRMLSPFYRTLYYGSDLRRNIHSPVANTEAGVAQVV
jgi:hypothetical protein